MKTEIINLNHVWAKYNQDPILEDINLTICEGDFVGLMKPYQGTVKIFNNTVRKGRRYIGYVPQLLELDREFPVSVAEVVRMGRLGKRRLLQRYTPKDESIVNRTLEQVGMLELRDTAIAELSGGQRQRVYIARALASEPRILLLDEPTASVDPQRQSSIYELLKELNQFITVIMISHDIGAISAYVKTVGCLNHRLFFHGDPPLSTETIEQTYQCPVDLIAHGVPHRVFSSHDCPLYHHE